MALFEPLYTADEMRAAEAGHDVATLMERAGRAVAEEAMRRFPDARSFAAWCGRGANGGDGRVAVEVLAAAGRQASVVEPDEAVDPPDVVVDALFGTGFRGAPRPEAAAAIERMNSTGHPVVAVDIPSGVDASSGEVAGPAVRAAVTVTFHGRKVGHVVAPGRLHAGDLVVADIGLDAADTAHRLVTREVLRLVPRKRESDNKYSAGSVLVVGGSPGLTGAACLTAEAAFRADAGYVAVAAPRESLPVLETRLLEAVKRPLEDVWTAVERASALAIGPGLGRERGRKNLVRRLLAETDVPAVVDADGLHELDPFTREAPTVLTPHEGELARLLGRESTWVAAHRLAALRYAVARFGAVVLLKGADTLIGAPGEGAIVRLTNTPGLATAGTGDVLTGVIAAFLAKGMDARLAAAAGATAQAVAAQLASEGRPGLIASDVVGALPRALA